MISAVYRLKRPRQFEVDFNNISLTSGKVLVRPTFLSICNADQRYYQGLRDEKILRQKLPMALIHEGIGNVVYDPSGTFEPDARVVMIPNVPVEQDEVTAENYLRSSRFCGSGMDGFLQEYIMLPTDRILRLPQRINPHVGAFTEIVSVSFHTISRFERFSHSRKNTISVWGDGNLGYITALLLRYRYPDARLVVFGVNDYKLNDFTFADDTYTTDLIPDGFETDHAFECVGSSNAPKAVNQIIDYIRPEGTIALMGVTEELAPINTRMVLEKGLRIFGSSRSGRADFEHLLALYEQKPEILDYLENIVGSCVTVRNVQDITTAFETDIHKLIGKTIMNWDI